MAERRNPLDLVFAGIVGALAAVVIMFVFTWATGDDGSTTTRAPTTTSPATTTAATTTTAVTTTTAPQTSTTTTFPGDTATKVAPGEPFGVSAFLADVRVAQREGFTRVVFDFEGDSVPWWEAGYLPGPFSTTSGELVPVSGTAYLQVLMSASGVDLTGEEFRVTYDGPGRIAADTASVVEIVRIEDFEGVSMWVIGVAAEQPFSVGTLQDPPRVYVDIAD